MRRRMRERVSVRRGWRRRGEHFDGGGRSRGHVRRLARGLSELDALLVALALLVHAAALSRQRQREERAPATKQGLSPKR